MKQIVPVLLPLVVVATFSSAASAAPSRWSTSLVGVSNLASPGNGIHILDIDTSTGGFVTAATSASFTGLDQVGTTRTMSFSGIAESSSEFGQLRSKTTGSLSNSYYNASNPVYQKSDGSVDPMGSPDSLVSLGFAGFDDVLRFGGQLQSGYRARYIFHVDGTNTGTGYLADLAVQIEDDAPESFFASNNGFISTNWATTSHEINGIVPEEIHVQFSTQVVFDTYNLADGGSYSGVSDFSSTLTLAAIEVTDASGNPVSGVTVTSESGTQYRVEAVPEPASFAVLAGGIVALSRRRRKRAA